MTKKSTSRNDYQKPQIAFRGALKQFAGSPLGKNLANPLNLPGGEK